MIGEPVLARVKETGAEAFDIRDGEMAFFEIGRIISPKIFGLLKGARVLDAEAKIQYENNIPRGALGFEVHSSTGKREFGLAHLPDNPVAWKLLVVVSADEAPAMQVRINIDMAKDASPVTCEQILCRMH